MCLTYDNDGKNGNASDVTFYMFDEYVNKKIRNVFDDIVESCDAFVFVVNDVHDELSLLQCGE